MLGRPVGFSRKQTPIPSFMLTSVEGTRKEAMRSSISLGRRRIAGASVVLSKDATKLLMSTIFFVRCNLLV
jgi:hypothetical protein